jgi:integrase
MTTTDFMLNLMTQLKDKNLSDKSIELYLKYLIRLNEKEPFKNLSFLKDKEKIMKIIDTYSDNTKKTIFSAIVSILSIYKDTPIYKSTYNFYYDKMMNKAIDMKNSIDTNEKTKTQKDNWINWNDILEIRNKMLEAVNVFIDNKTISTSQFNLLLDLLILSLYTLVAPRRNEYMDMYLINEYKDGLDENKNYLDFSNKQFVFLTYKTSKKYGVQKVDIPDDLFNIIKMYLKHHPLNPSKGKFKFPKNTEIKFLVYNDGSNFNSNNAITRILNKIFNKKIGSSMLRHIYLSSKYDISEMQEDAENMGHSLEQQKEYLKR